MQFCPFCEFDHRETMPRDGRCHQCGAVIAWPEPPQSHTAQLTPLAPKINPASPTIANPETHSPTSIESIDVPEDVTSPRTHVVNDSRKKSASVNQNQDSSASGSAEQAIEGLWRSSLTDGITNKCTLKGESTGGTVSDSHLFIKERDIRGDSQDLPSAVDYELLDVIGQGGVGVVYSARQSSIDRQVAIKMLRQEYRSRDDHRDKFLAEAVVTGELDHPNIVPIYDLGRSVNGELFYSMKKVEGTPWDRVIAQKTQRENLDILMKVSDAVAFAHARGVIHRDLKPENVMLGSFGEVLVMDWGIALPTAGFRKSSNIKRSQAMGGTPAYMAPEMATGPIENITQAADVYLLGAILFEILVGQPPHYGTDVMECVANASKNLILKTESTGELMDIASLAMSTIPRRRYRSVQDFQAAIRLYQSHIESITLSDNAQRDLDQAETNKDYQEYSRLLFAFREAISLWDDNLQAKDGLKQTQLEYASLALEKGDYDLGLSLLEPENMQHQTLLHKLTAAQKERAARQLRLKLVRNVAIGLMGFIILAGSIALAVILQLFNRVSLTNAELGVAQANLQQEIVKVNVERERAEKQRAEAQTQSTLAESRRRDAETARLESVSQRMRAEENSYVAELGLAKASIEDNGFALAADVLLSQSLSPSKSKLRHWEWGRNWFLVQGGASDDQHPAVSTYRCPDAVKAIDVSNDEKWVAVGMASGICELWSKGEQQARFSFRHGISLNDLDFDSSGERLVTCGMHTNQSADIKIWSLRAAKAPEMAKSIPHKGPNIDTVAFSNDVAATYVVANDRQRIGRIWMWREPTEVSVLLGHLESITSAEFSPDDQIVATASLDGSVRLWHRDSGEQVQRFQEHHAPVQNVVFSPDGKNLASAGADGSILLWRAQPSASKADKSAETIREIRGERTDSPSFRKLSGHQAAVRQLAFSRDGTKLVSSANDNLLCVWPVSEFGATGQPAVSLVGDSEQLIESPEPVQKLRGHGGWVGTCCFLPDASEVISGSDDHSWKTWRLAKYHETLRFGSRGTSITSAHFAPAGDKIATAHLDGSVELHDIRSGKSMAILKEGHEYLSNDAKFISGGKQLVTGAGDNTVRLWDVERGSQLAVLENTGRNAAIALSSDSRWLAASGDQLGVGLWDLSNLDLNPIRLRSWEQSDSKVDESSEPTSVAVSDDGATVFIGDKAGRIEFWDTKSRSIRHQVFGHAESVVASFILPTKPGEMQAVISISSDGTAALWDVASGTQLPGARLQHFAPVQCAALSSDGQLLCCSVAAERGNSKVWLWNLETRKSLATKDLQGELVQDIAFHNTELRAVLLTTSTVANSAKNIWAWEPDSGKLAAIGTSAMRPETLWGVQPNDDSTSLLTYGGRGARLWNLKTESEIMAFRPSSAVQTIEFSPSGNYLAAGNQDGTITLWSCDNFLSQRKLMGGHLQTVLDIAFSPDGKKLVSTGADGRLTLWDAESGKIVMRVRLGEQPVRGLAIRFSSDGEQLVVAGDDHSIRIHDALTLKVIKKLDGHRAAVTSVDLSVDGRWIVSGGVDKSVRLWSVATGQQVAEMLGHSAQINAVSFSSDGLRVLSASQDTQVKLWDVDRLARTNAGEFLPSFERSETDFVEVYSLDFHAGEATVAEFAPDGRSILTAGLDGYAVVWPTEKVPPALRLSTTELNYRTGTGPARIDPWAVVSLPGTQALRGGKLTVTLVGEELDSKSLAAEHIGFDQRDGSIVLTDNAIVSRSDKKNDSVVGSMNRFPRSIVVDFGDEVTHDQIQKVIRLLTYEATQSQNDSLSGSSSVALTLTDKNGKSGNAQPESIEIRISSMQR